MKELKVKKHCVEIKRDPMFEELFSRAYDVDTLTDEYYVEIDNKRIPVSYDPISNTVSKESEDLIRSLLGEDFKIRSKSGFWKRLFSFKF